MGYLSPETLNPSTHDGWRMEVIMEWTERVKVKIDLHKVASNLRTPEGSPGEGAARSFMQYAGFNPHIDGTWVGPRASLRRLNPGEVVGVEALND